ncbi:MAG: hypothetical protein ACR2M1_13660 [Gemmatimonadaceae bacterium]
MIGCGGSSAAPQKENSPEKTETRIAGAVWAPTKGGKAVTVGLHVTIVSERRTPPTEPVIRAALTSAQAFIRDSVTSPVTLSTAVAAGREIPALTRYAVLANPVPSYTINRSRFTWVTAGDGVKLTNDQCVDKRQRFIALPGSPGAYVCAPTTLGWSASTSENATR